MTEHNEQVPVDTCDSVCLASMHKWRCGVGVYRDVCVWQIKALEGGVVTASIATIGPGGVGPMTMSLAFVEPLVTPQEAATFAATYGTHTRRCLTRTHACTRGQVGGW